MAVLTRLVLRGRRRLHVLHPNGHRVVVPTPQNQCDLNPKFETGSTEWIYYRLVDRQTWTLFCLHVLNRNVLYSSIPWLWWMLFDLIFGSVYLKKVKLLEVNNIWNRGILIHRKETCANIVCRLRWVHTMIQFIIIFMLKSEAMMQYYTWKQTRPPGLSLYYNAIVSWVKEQWSCDEVVLCTTFVCTISLPAKASLGW